MKRLLVSAAFLAAVAGAGVGPAQATNECRGLPVCVRVAGPWVVVPGSSLSPRPPVEFQLSCPRGFVVGGLDAELTDRAIEVEFGGRLASPVSPGATTSRSALFQATYTGPSARGPSFRPHLGCLPTSGGGSGPVPYRRLAAVFPPGEPTIRRVRNVQLRPGALQRVASACGANERLISSWHAVAFYTRQAPSSSLIQGVRTKRRVRGKRVEVRVQSGTALQGVRAIVQVGAICGGGS